MSNTDPGVSSVSVYSGTREPITMRPRGGAGEEDDRHRDDRTVEMGEWRVPPSVLAVGVAWVFCSPGALPHVGVGDPLVCFSNSSLLY